MKTKSTKNSIVCCLIALLAVPVLGAFGEAPAGFSVQLVSTFDYPGSGNSTEPQKISDLGDIVGDYIDSSLVERGFIRFRNGTFSAPIVHPNDTSGRTQGRGINNSRLVCGDYLDAPNYHGFFLRRSMFHNLDVPGSSSTLILGLNNAGDFCGEDVPGSLVPSAFFSVGGVITEFTVPNAIASVAYQINSSNQVCGYFIDDSSSFILHGYFRDSDGTIYAPIDPAGSTFTVIFGNNDSNWMVGRYE